MDGMYVRKDSVTAARKVLHDHDQLQGLSETFEAHDAMEALRRLGVEHMKLLLGDRGGAVELLAREVGLSSTGAEMIPEEKVDVVRALEREYGGVAMVGDGINDVPALAVIFNGLRILSFREDA